jgi:hypothetical protein
LFFPTVPSANTLVRWVNENAFASIMQARPCPTFGRPVHLRGSPHRLRPGSSPHALRIPSRDGHPALRWIPPSADDALPPSLDIAPLIRVPEGLQPSRTTRCSAHTMAWSDSSRACTSAVWLCAFADRPRSLAGRGAPEVSRFSCMLFLSVRGFSDYAGPSDRSRLSRISRCAFLHQEGVGVLVLRFSKLNRPAHRYPCLRFERHLTMPPARLRAKMESLSPFL